MFRITLILNNLLFEEPVVSTGSSIYRKIPLPTDGRYTRKKIGDGNEIIVVKN